MCQLSKGALNWLETIIVERFGSQFRLSPSDQGIKLLWGDHKNSIYFVDFQSCFVRSSSGFPCNWWTPESEGWDSPLSISLPAPGLCNLPFPLIEKKGSDYYIHYDILGLTFWMLARVEEIGSTDLDNHDRFPASSSNAFKHGYIDRPVVDEWHYILGQVIQRTWPEIELKQHDFRIIVSHDVDRPFEQYFVSPTAVMRQTCGDIVRRRNPSLAYRRILNWKAVNSGDLTKDSFYTFDWIMDQSERYGLTSAFYFICGVTNRFWEGHYDIEHPIIRNLLRRIHERGHEIGLHPSYETYRQPDLIKSEFNKLLQVCEDEKISQKKWGGRMHYLRWDPTVTLTGWNDAGLDYDSTLTYADHAGFRCGTCREYPAFDVNSQQALNLRIRPLIAMECSILDNQYQGLDFEEALAYLALLKNNCEKVQGCFSLLWHNSEFTNVKHKELYKTIISN